MRHTAITGLLAIAAVGVLAGCTTAPASPAPTGAAESASPTPADQTRPTAEAITCDSLIPAADRETMTADGWELVEAYEQTLRIAQHPNVAFLDYGGAICLWGPPNSSGVVFAGSAIDEAAEQMQRERLASEGYSTREHNGADLFDFTDETGGGNVYLFVDDYWFYANTERDVDLIRQNADLG
jgi:hypothetical protein